MTQATTGQPCWYELTTPDPVAAGHFYAALLGWEMDHTPMPGMEYSVARVAGVMVAGMMRPPAPGIPPNWLIYFVAPAVDATVAAMLGDGAAQVVPPTDIPGTGRFAVLQDPQGAYFALLQPLEGDSGGAFDPGRTGHGHWHELTTGDPVAALAFYARHLGWSAAQAYDMGPLGSYQTVATGSVAFAGLMRAPSADIPAHWVPYFGTGDIDAAVSAVQSRGGRVLNGPMPVPDGRIIQATDPQGAYVALAGPA